jgi:hypothetical protein
VAHPARGAAPSAGKASVGQVPLSGSGTLREGRKTTRYGPSPSRNGSYPDPLATARKVAMPIVADEVMRFQALYAMASISILVPAMFFACNAAREGLLPGKNSA